MLLHFNGWIPWIWWQSELHRMVYGVLVSNLQMEQHNLGCTKLYEHNDINSRNLQNVKDDEVAQKEQLESEYKLHPAHIPFSRTHTQYDSNYCFLYPFSIINALSQKYFQYHFNWNWNNKLTLHLLYLLDFGFKSSLAKP